MHLGCHNRNRQYTMDGNQITSVSLQRGLDILISCDLRCDQQVNESCKKASKVHTSPLQDPDKASPRVWGPILGDDLEETRWANGAYQAPCYKTYSGIM